MRLDVRLMGKKSAGDKKLMRLINSTAIRRLRRPSQKQKLNQSKVYKNQIVDSHPFVILIG